MKKLLIFAMLLLMGHGAFAQGGLTIDNTNGKCGVWVKMSAIDLFSGFPTACQLDSWTFLVPAGANWSWCNVYEFQGPIGPCSIAASTPGIIAPGWAFGGPVLAFTPTFQWTDVTFQWMRCNDCNGGNNMSNICSPYCYAVTNFGFAASPSCPATNYATWSPVCLGLLANLTLTFYS